MFKTLGTIIKDNWQWRKQIGRLAVFDLIKRSRGAVLSWAWLFIKPAVFIFVFWFALDIGLRAGGENAYPPYFLWLVAGLIPWFYMQEMLGAGSDVLHRYSYLVNKIKFPLSGISTIFNISTLLVHCGLVIVLFAIYFISGLPFDIHMLQIPVIVLVMFTFFNMYSIMTSQLSALSKDFANLIKAFMTPFFWLSGIIFNVADLGISWIQNILLFNPITFFATAYRDVFYYQKWVWEDPMVLGSFGIVFLVTLIAMCLVYKRCHEEVSDAL